MTKNNIEREQRQMVRAESALKIVREFIGQDMSFFFQIIIDSRNVVVLF